MHNPSSLRYFPLWFVLVASTAVSVASCDGDTNDGGAQTPIKPVQLDSSDFTYRLSESTDDIPLWTMPATRKLKVEDRAPSAKRSGLRLSAARNEFEPVQLVIGPAAGDFGVSVEPFPNLGSDQRVDLSAVGYEEGWAEHLTPISKSLSLSGTHGTGVWLTVYVPTSAPKGEHTTTLTVAPSSGPAINIPVTLYVFDFALPNEIHFATQLNLNISNLIADGQTVDDAKSMLFEHRMTPKSVTWPSGFNYNITWDNDASPNQCEQFWDEPDEGERFSIGALGPRYILGQGWNGVGFPNAMIFQFENNSTPRPSSLCGIDRGDHYGTDAYNAEWSQWLSAVDSYLTQNNMAEKAYYYVQNEPQDDEDHRLAAYLCQQVRAAAPNLRIAVSDEAKPEIAENPDFACGYDIWIAHVRAYDKDYAWQRQRDHGEVTWFYSLDQDPAPYFNPTRIDTQGIHERIMPWVAWGLRIQGWAYYDANRFFDGTRPTVRAELLREGFEDYEYLYLANGGGHPRVGDLAAADPTALSVATSLTSWTKNPDALMALRHELGLYIEGSRTSLPVLEVDSDLRPRGNYYLNFQDPNGAPTADPLTIDGKTYIKIGWQAYDDDTGFGWAGEHIDNPSIALFGYDEVAGFGEAQKSYLYDDYGRNNLFEFALENGSYEVTVGVGRPARGYPGDPHNLIVEGMVFVDDEVTTDAEPTLTRTQTITVSDGSLSFEVGGKSAQTGDFAYTFLSFVHIEAID